MTERKGVLKGGDVAYRTTIKQWPARERPRERLMQEGPAALVETELLAILIRTGSRGLTALDLARRLLSDGRTLRDVARMTVSDLKEYGIGPARATAVIAAFELHRRLPGDDGVARPIFRTPDDVASRYGPKLRDLKQEEFWVLLLSSANQLTKEARITVGTLNAALADPRECFHLAVREKAASVIFLHNHPSGNPEPSQEDIALRRQLVEAGRILGIPVHDHVIVASGGSVSLADRGVIGS